MLLSALCLALLVVCAPDIGAARQAPQPAVPQNASVDELLATADTLLGEFKGNTAFPFFERALEGARADEALEPQEARAHYGLAQILYYRTQYAAAREHALKAAAIYERLSIRSRHRTHEHVFSARSRICSGRFAEARTHAERAVAAYEVGRRPARPGARRRCS